MSIIFALELAGWARRATALVHLRGRPPKKYAELEGKSGASLEPHPTRLRDLHT